MVIAFLRLIFCFVMIFPAISPFCLGQNSKKDSLERVIKTTKSDTVRGRSLCRLCKELDDLDLALQKGHQGIKILEQAGDGIGTAICLNIVGVLNMMKNDYPLARKYFNQSISVSEKAGYDKGIAAAYNNLGRICEFQGDFKQAIACNRKSLAIQEREGDQIGIAISLNNIGAGYERLGDNRTAIDYFYRSLLIYDKLNMKSDVALSYHNIAIIYEDFEDYNTALAYLEKSLKLYQQIDHEEGVGYVNLNIGNVKGSLKKHKEALIHFKRSLAIFEKRGDQRVVGSILSKMGEAYLQLTQYDDALLSLNESYRLLSSIDAKGEIAETLILLAQAFFHKNQIQQAKSKVMLGYQLAQQNGQLDYMNIAVKTLFQIEKKEGNYQLALKWHELHKQYADSLTNEIKSRELGRLETQYEHRKLQEKQALLDEERRMRTNYIYTGIVIVILGVTGFFFYRFRTKAKNNRILKAINDELAFKNQEVLEQRDELTISNEEISTQRDELAAQADQLAFQRDELNEAYHELKELDAFKEAMTGMIVHDLKNPLSAIISLSDKPQLSPKDQTIIHQAGKQMLNLTLNILDVQKFEQAEVPLHLKDEALTHLVQEAFDQVSLLASNKNLQLSTTFELNMGVFCDGELITRVLMNLLTNAIKYTPNNGKITITAEDNADNQVRISVSDTGQGIPADKLATVFDKFSQVEAKKSGGARSTGLGLTFCKLTVEAHSGQIGVESEVGVGTTFYFTLPKSLQEVKGGQPVVIPAYESTEINLTAEDKAIMQPYLTQLQALDVYEAGEVLKIIARIPDSPALFDWKSDMERTVFASNEVRYGELIGLPLRS